MSTCDELNPVKTAPFANAVFQLQSLFNNCGALTFLLGAGSSKCAGLPLTSELTDKVLVSPELDSVTKNILVAVRKIFNQAPDANIEDYLSDIVDLLAITDRRTERGISASTISVGDSNYKAHQLRSATDQIKRAIAGAVLETVTLNTHQEFIAAVHQPARVGRPTGSQPVDYLILNYDTIIEDSLAINSIPYADGLYGGATAWWDPNTFDYSGLSARVIKLHGSVDWYQLSNDPMPRRIRQGIALPQQNDMPLLIWPSSTKYQETQLNPFAQLLDRARAAMRPNNREQRLLVVCGYSFRDKHINLEIEKALKDSQEDLTMVAFTDRDSPTGPLAEWRNDASIRQQLLVFADRGFFHGDTEITVEKSLKWWKFENLTRLLTTDI